MTSPLSVVQEGFFLNYREHKSAIGSVAKLAYIDEPSSHMKPAQDWLWANAGKKSLRYAENPIKEIGIVTRISLGLRIMADQKTWASRFSDLYGYVEIRRIRHSQYWRREDPITQLAPGATRRVKSSTTIGLAQADAAELSASLGLQGSVPSIISLNGQISGKLGRTINVSFQRQEEEELTLTNDKAGYYRLFAIWHPVQSLEVHYLGIVDARLAWFTLKKVSFTENSSVQLTSADISVRS